MLWCLVSAESDNDSCHCLMDARCVHPFLYIDCYTFSLVVWFIFSLNCSQRQFWLFKCGMKVDLTTAMDCYGMVWQTVSKTDFGIMILSSVSYYRIKVRISGTVLHQFWPLWNHNTKSLDFSKLQTS